LGILTGRGDSKPKEAERKTGITEEGGGGHTKELSQKGYGYFVENTIHAYNLLGLNKNILKKPLGKLRPCSHYPGEM